MTSREKTRERVHWIIQELQKGDYEGSENRLAELMLEYDERIEELAAITPRNHDIAALIQEMRNGFAAMDKRFDDLIHQMDKRFSLIQWFMGIGFTFFAFILTYGTFFK